MFCNFRHSKSINVFWEKDFSYGPRLLMANHTARMALRFMYFLQQPDA